MDTHTPTHLLRATKDVLHCQSNVLSVRYSCGDREDVIQRLDDVTIHLQQPLGRALNLSAGGTLLREGAKHVTAVFRRETQLQHRGVRGVQAETVPDLVTHQCYIK